MTKLLTTLAALALSATTLSANVYFDGSTGTSAPPATLGGYTMTAFDDDTRDLFDDVSSVAGPTGDVGFSPDLNHRSIGSGWATWSHGYTGDVYSTNGTSVTLTLPAGTRAFQFYAEPNSFATWTMEAISSDGTSSGEIEVTGAAGAQYFGFYADGSDVIEEIVVTAESGALGFAIGEFAIYTCPPVELSISLNKTLLTPPNHKMVDITATVTSSGGCGVSNPVLVSVTSNEPDNGVDDGNTVNDIDGVSAGTSDYAFRVRAERCGSCTGRIYTVTYAVTDEMGNVTEATAEISVPVGLGGLD
ncbi:MAG TPA: hypothetical protein VNA88_16215 [Candidatus Kapabacteria bacterium]|nr:hypothetical protein [Candidatus Kapabacteria bacterium]